MDTLVAQYSRPMFEKENYSQDEQVELYQSAPILSPRFAMPPVAQVGTNLPYCTLSRGVQTE
jgi:20S proteasome subunit beta 5